MSWQLHLAASLAVLTPTASAFAAPLPEPAPLPSRTSAPAPRDSRRSTDELVELHVTSAGYGVLTGLWLHELSGDHTIWSFALPAVGVGALSAFAITSLDRNQSLTLGLPQAIASDTFIGLEIASAWAWHFRAVNGANDQWSGAQESTLLWGGATLGAGIGVLRYALSPSPPGRAAFTGSVTLWSGALSGLLAAALTTDPAKRDDRASQATAIGLEAGVVVGAFAGRLLKPSTAWVRALDAGALLGGGVAVGTYALASGRSFHDRVGFAAGAGGIGVGLLSAALLAPRLGWPRTLGFSVRPDFAPGLGTAGASIQGVF